MNYRHRISVPGVLPTFIKHMCGAPCLTYLQGQGKPRFASSYPAADGVYDLNRARRRAAAANGCTGICAHIQARFSATTIDADEARSGHNQAPQSASPQLKAYPGSPLIARRCCDRRMGWTAARFRAEGARKLLIDSAAHRHQSRVVRPRRLGRRCRLLSRRRNGADGADHPTLRAKGTNWNACGMLRGSFAKWPTGQLSASVSGQKPARHGQILARHSRQSVADGTPPGKLTASGISVATQWPARLNSAALIVNPPWTGRATSRRSSRTRKKSRSVRAAPDGDGSGSRTPPNLSQAVTVRRREKYDRQRPGKYYLKALAIGFTSLPQMERRRPGPQIF